MYEENLKVASLEEKEISHLQKFSEYDNAKTVTMNLSK